MGKIWSSFTGLFGKLGDVLGKKVLMAVVGLILGILHTKFPDWPLPSNETIAEVIIALLSAHTLTDVVYILKTGGKEVVKEIVDGK